MFEVALRSALMVCDNAALGEYLKSGGDPDAVLDEGGNRALHIAAEVGCSTAVALLIAHGALVDVRDEDGWTPLHVACLWSRRSTVEKLLENGADINARTYGDSTPLQIVQLNVELKMKGAADWPPIAHVTVSDLEALACAIEQAGGEA